MSDSASPRRSRDGRRRTGPPAPRRAMLLVLAGASALVLASCEDGIFPPEEQRDEIERRRSHTSPPDVSGSANIPVPETNTDNTGYVPWFSTGIALPERVWIEVRVSGTITLDANPEYTENYCSDPSCTPYAGRTVSPVGIDGGSWLRVGVRVVMSDGQQIEPKLYLVPGSETDAHVFVWLTTPGVLHVNRWGVTGGGSCWFNRPPGYPGPGPCPGGTDYHQAGAYTMSGAQTVTVEAVPPAEVHARRTWFQPGDTITFDAEVAGTLVSLVWSFAEGDTLPKASMKPNILRPCPDLHLTCRYAPRAPGRMYITVLTSGQNVHQGAFSQVVRIGEPPPLRLDAVPSELEFAGQEAVFTAAAEGAGSLEIVEWAWTVADAQIAPLTQTCTAGVNPCETAVYESGTMTVSARVDGVPDTASATVTAPTAGPLKLDVDPSHEIPRGTSATFTPSAANAHLIHARMWEWEAADTTLRQPGTEACTSGENPCVTPIHEPGYMHLNAIVDGRQRSASAFVIAGDRCDPRPSANCPGLTAAIDSLKNDSEDELCRDLGAKADSILSAGQILRIPEPIYYRGHAFSTRDGAPGIALADSTFIPGILKPLLAHEAAHHDGIRHREDDPLAATATQDVEVRCRS